jgi:uncharacterized RDD family membrane protein YckC
MVDAVVSPLMTPIVSAVDVDDVVDRIDVEQLIERIDLDRMVERIDLDRAIARVDVNGVIERVDANALLDRVDPNALLDRVDPDRLLDRVDANRLLDRVDANRLLDRVDVARLIDRVDLDAVMERIDVNALVRRTELNKIIARSTTGVFGDLLDAARGVTVSLDLIIQGTVGRVVRPKGESRPGRPGNLDDVVESRTMSMAERGVAMQGRHAGSLSRFLAFLLDQFVLGLLFVWGQTLVSLALSVVTGHSFHPTSHRWVVLTIYIVWFFVYLAGQLAVAGRTLGMAVLGLRVVRNDGERLEGRRAALRTVVFPLSFIIFGIGLLMGLVRRDRRELHDLLAGTAVVYQWDAEMARLRAPSHADSPDGTAP